MYYLYVDESGDPGIVNSPTRYYVLAGLVVHELIWKEWLERLIAMRRQMKNRYGLKMREEIHAAPFIQKPGDLARIPKHHRLLILREVLDTLAAWTDISVYAVIIDKQKYATTGHDIFEWAWRLFLQRFDNTLGYRNFSGPQNPRDLGVVLTDRTNEHKLKCLMRTMRHHNPVPSQFPGYSARNLQTSCVTEDPILRDSGHSYFVQAADVVAYMLHQQLVPNKYIKKVGARNYFCRLDPVLCKAVSRLGTGYVLP